MSDRVTFGVLGPLAAHRGEALLNLGGPRQRLVLAVLLANANRTVSRDELIDAVWSDGRPPSARTTLYTYLSNLRKELGTGQILHHDNGYEIEADTDSLDAIGFELLTEEGHGLLTAHPAEAAKFLDRALRLWRGPAFGELCSEQALISEATRLCELRLLAEEDRFEAYLASGEHGRLIPQLQSLTVANPYRERLVGQLMIALYRSGRQADALRVFADARRRFADELGIDPAPELWLVEQEILEHRPHPSTNGQRTDHHGGEELKSSSPNPGFGRKWKLTGLRRRLTSPAQVALVSVVAGVLAVGILANSWARDTLVSRPGCVQVPDGPAAWWTGDEGTADALGAYPASLVNGASYGEGMIGKAFLLDGVDDWIDVSGPGPEIGASDFTVDLWVNFRSTEGEQVLVEKWVETYDASAVGWTFTKLGDNSVGLYGHGFGAMSRPLYLSTNKWLHFAARREDSTLTLLVNGVVVDQQAVDPSATDMVTPASLKFGHRGGADDTPGTDDRRGFYLSGLIDEAHLFIGRALTFDEIESIYEARAAGLCPLGSRV